ncbi:MAG TPA: tRNA-dihydrouridine synthase [Phycisphaerales bacterium]|nr:tRNA-dihydrouridine synthase [Phycisphaerales bacterium]
MSVNGNNATPPSPAIAPGAEGIDTAAFARELGNRWPGGVDPRVPALVPGFDAPFFQAGLAGYSDAAMRILARRHGAPFAVTEALLDRMLLGGGHGFDKADLELMAEALPASAEDQPLAGQIIGSDPDEMAAAALKMIEQASRGDKQYRKMAYGEGPRPEGTDPRWAAVTTEPVVECADACDEEGCEMPAVPESYDPRIVFHGRVVGERKAPAVSAPVGLAFATIDVNLACPVKKIDRKQRGGHWLSEPEGAVELLKAVRAAVPKDVVCTVKLRRAYDDTPEMASNFERIFEKCYELGYAWTTVHARTVEQKYLGPSRWTFLKDLCSRHRDKLVFGSGDVWDVHDIFRMMAYAGVTGVSVARGCIGNPWIFRQARQMIAGLAPATPTLAEQRAVLMEHFRLSIALNGERAGGRMMRKFAIKFARHHPDPESVKAAMCRVSTLAEWQGALDAHYPAGAAVEAGAGGGR